MGIQQITGKGIQHNGNGNTTDNRNGNTTDNGNGNTTDNLLTYLLNPRAPAGALSRTGLPDFSIDVCLGLWGERHPALGQAGAGPWR